MSNVNKEDYNWMLRWIITCATFLLFALFGIALIRMDLVEIKKSINETKDTQAKILEEIRKK